MIVLQACWRSSKEVPMGIIGGLDVHRSQITFDWIDSDSGQRERGQLAPAHREHLRMWLEQFAGRQAAFALEGCTGWRYVVEELTRAGIAARQDRPAGCSPSTGAAGRRAAAGELDPAGARAGGPHPGALLQGAGGRAHRLAATGTRHLVPPWRARPA